MRINAGAYEVCFENGGVRVNRDGELLYFNDRPVYVSVKTYAAINEFRDISYDRTYEKGETVTGEGLFITGNGSEILVRDTWEICAGAGFRKTRKRWKKGWGSWTSGRTTP